MHFSGAFAPNQVGLIYKILDSHLVSGEKQVSFYWILN